MTASPFAKPSDYSGSSIFKSKDHMNDLALMVEPKSVARDVPHTYQNKTSTRDEVVADVTVFANQAALDSGVPTEILKSTKFVHGMLTDTLSKIIGGVMVGIITKVPTQNGSGFAFRDASEEVTEKVAAYYHARAAAVAAAPGFE